MTSNTTKRNPTPKVQTLSDGDLDQVSGGDKRVFTKGGTSGGDKNVTMGGGSPTI